MDRTSDARLAEALAAAAGRELLAVRAAAGRMGPAGLRETGDGRAQRVLAEMLAAERPSDAVLSEEAADDPARLSASRVWIIDPLDGTREFAEPPRTDWAVHVALWERGELAAGAVALPAAGLMYTADPPAVLPPRATPVVRLAVSRTRPPAFVRRLAERVGAELVPMGSAGVKATAVLRNEVDAYVHAGGQYEWDSAAPVAVARAAGLHVSRIDGSPLVYNQEDPLLPDLAVCRPELAAALLAAIADLPEEVTVP